MAHPSKYLGVKSMEAHGKPLRVLVVEDSEDDTLLMVDQLAGGGYGVAYTRVETAEQMSAALRRQTWDLVIADYRMPHFSGPAALEILCKSGLDIPFILVSGTAEEDAGVEMMRAGACDFIMKHSLTRLGPAVDRELADAESRRQRKLSEERERAAQVQKREFYRRTILAATGGKLVIAEPDEIGRVAGPSVQSWEIVELDSLREVRDDIHRLASDYGMSEANVFAFVGCAVEAMANAHKHAGGGRVTLHELPDGLLLVVSDTGAGIETLALPDVALTKGYSTADSLGMGYKVMIEFADRLYLTTGPEGTIVAIEKSLREKGSARDTMLETLAGW
jgi:FixJ family two-component response regulator/anti-sigma regulatory factor (Ser/Thr protein kinase)